MKNSIAIIALLITTLALTSCGQPKNLAKVTVEYFTVIPDEVPAPPPEQ